MNKCKNWLSAYDCCAMCREGEKRKFRSVVQIQADGTSQVLHPNIHAETLSCVLNNLSQLMSASSTLHGA